MSTQRGPVHEGGSRRYQMLDVWRGVVALLVVLEHAGVVLWPGSMEPTPGWEGWLRRGLVGVLSLNLGTPLFFVMSGYCIAASIESSRRKGQTPSAFLARRLWRIYPTYWVALFGFAAIVLVFDGLGLTRLHQSALGLEIVSPRTLTRAQWLGNLSLTETWRSKLGGGYSLVYTRVAWSLCYQEQFYIICCLALWLAPGRLHRALAWITAAIVALRVVAWDSGALSRLDGTFPFYWHEFAVGLAVYWRLNAAAEAPRMTRHGVDLGIAALALIGLTTGVASTAGAALFGLVLIGLFRWDAVAGRLACLDPIRACGRRSYSIYLVHLPVVSAGNVVLYDLGLSAYWTRVLVLMPLVTAAAVAVAWAFHHAIERHFIGAPTWPKVSLGGPRRGRPSIQGTVAVKPA